MDYFMGAIMPCGFNFAPYNWAACNGAQLQISQNSALYALLGIQFGGNGTTNFNLPNLCGKVAVGSGSDGATIYQVGDTFGAKTKTLVISEMPLHSHTLAERTPNGTVVFGTPTATSTANNPTAAVTVNGSNAQATAPTPAGNYWAKSWNGTSVTPSYYNAKNVTMASDAVAVTITVPITTTVTMSPSTFNANNLAIGTAGGSVPFSLAPPSLVINYIICTAGIFPSRG